MRVLVLNAGSRTLKASLVVDGVAGARAEAPATEADPGVAALLADLPLGEPLDAVAHRLVHGGERFTAPVVADDGVLGTLRGLVSLAPLHLPPALRVLDDAMARFPGVPHVCCFDTAFHVTLSEAETRYPVPDQWTIEWHIRRFGFHGLSVEWSAMRAAELLGRAADEVCLVVAHLGGGCSVTAVDGGRSVRTSMGYTPLEGLMMGTRSGSVDPGMLLTLLRDGRLGVEELGDHLEHRSGLLGVSGVSADVREVEAASDAGAPRAVLALAMFAARAASGIAAAATALPRIDAVVFTGGIGEHAGRLRGAIVDQLSVLGVGPVTAEETGADRILSHWDDGPRVLRIEAREDLVCARQATELLRPDAALGPGRGSVRAG
jgi:acetate kinase